jgi:serine kinase of HPr protein (carbohydrate metabolism regulator)
MKLKSLEIELQKWGENEGKYLSTIKYEGEKGEIKMLLDSKISGALLVCIGETITSFAAEASKQVESSIIQSLGEAKQGKALDVG